ncbi:helix-turn-helix transcriptional regulator [Streptomyces sp. NPDC026672]|uniref:helix-turn-helix transcriptional regulator n=1 Tax=unclassified Streptomyces TaxID=2593676 RepID=UPI00340C3120
MGQRRNPEFGDFLRSRRAALSPAEAGFALYGPARRVPGLRREEVAELAGISVHYYTRIEQGETHHLSDSVLAGLANALRLGPVERRHLVRLARAPHRRRHRPDDGEVRDSVRAIVEENTGQAAFLLGPRADLLTANPLGYALLGVPPGRRANLARLVFLEPAARELFVGWEEEARQVTAFLRMASGSWAAGDQELADLIGELSDRSEEFAHAWRTHSVADCLPRTQECRHPHVGHLTLRVESLRLPDAPGRIVVFCGAPSGSPTADRLRLLGSMAAPQGAGSSPRTT